MAIASDTLDDIYSLMNYAEEGIFLVEGEQIGTGSDNEPLIKDVVVLSEITDMFYKKNNDKEEI